MSKSAGQRSADPIVRQVATSDAFEMLRRRLGELWREPPAVTGPLLIDHVAPPAQPFYLSLLAGLIFSTEATGKPHRVLWVLCRDTNQQELLAAELPVWWDGDVHLFPQHEAVYFEDALPDPETAAERLAVLRILSSRQELPAGHGSVVLLHHESLDESVPAPGALVKEEIQFDRGSPHDPEDLCARLLDAGYEKAPQVFQRGQFARRGGILDVFSWHANNPVRLEFFDREIDSIRAFDIDAQTSISKLESATVLLRDTDDTQATLRDYVQHGDPVVAVECAPDASSDATIRLTESTEEIDDRKTPAWASFETPLGEFGAGDFVLQQTRRDDFIRQVRQWRTDGWDVHMFFNNQGEIDRFEELLDPQEFPPELIRKHPGALQRGWILPAARLAVLSDAELFGRYQHARSQRLFKRTRLQSQPVRREELNELRPDDLVVHAEYGIGRYAGLDQIDGSGGARDDVLVIEYADDAKLYVPLENSHLVSRYIGAGKKAPKLHRLGSTRWAQTRKTAEKAIRDYAGQLLSTQAERQAFKAYRHAPDSRWQWEFENAFLHRETRDQLRAIQTAKSDMESRRPMDRLICGDVGFGKTEVAIRAAFKAVMSGKQAAILVPTTVLAQQHFETFRERMSDYPIQIELLSRFRSQSKQREVVRKLAGGSVDIVIGTHRLISRDIVFKDLGLVVIDEEQRFGVRHKERFKEMFHLIDVLTLPATPIPRTRYLSLMGVKDMSSIETPPPNRLPIHTTICGYDERIIRDAIDRELNRSGQVYFLHNRVQSIGSVKQKIEHLCPGARVAVGHGQMDGTDLEQIMHRFVAAEIDVLVCTTIVESGIDIPNVNTIIIDRADRFGLADLYQLRGRVGRAQKKAYAILMLPRHLITTGDARKRIQAIRQYSSLGAGFKIAMRDLEIRGAGNLLGTQQSGHMAAIGFDLYCKLLRHSIGSLAGDSTAPRPDVRLRVDFLATGESEYLHRHEDGAVPAYIPGGYIEEARLRIFAYRQVAEAANRRELRSLRRSWRDQFGPLPDAVKNLLDTTELKLLAGHSGITEIEIREGKLMLTRRGDYILLEGRFPRLAADDNRRKLRQALDLLKKM